jgi:hypothetical protein
MIVVEIILNIVAAVVPGILWHYANTYKKEK